MKKKIVTTALSIFMLSCFTIAQTTSEIYQLSNSQAAGSARYNGLSGAFGALGGDFTALGENAAAGAVFSHSNGSITFGYANKDYTTDYLGNSTISEFENLRLNQVGAIMVLKTAGVRKGGITKFSLGIAYNRENDYREEYSFGGNANNSIGDYFVSQANAATNNFGLEPSELSVNDGESLNSVYSSFADEFSSQQALLGFQGDVLGILDDGSYQSNIAAGSNQQINIINRGSSDKTTLNMSMELDKSIYLGANLNIHSLDYEKNLLYTETNTNADSSIREVNYDNSISTVGQGFSFGFGAIAKLGKQLRLGASYNSPRYLYLEDELIQSVQTINSEGVVQSVVPNISTLYPQYRINMPSIITGSAAIVFGKKGLISGQYSRQDFSEITYDYGDFAEDIAASDAVNQDIENTFGTVNTLKIGAEIKSKRWSLRGGFSNASSPYKDTSIQGDTNGYSLGAGYDWGKWKLDFAYGRTETDFNEALFENEAFNNSAAVNKLNQSFTSTLSVNF